MEVIIRTIEQLQLLSQAIDAHETWAFDLETNSLNVRKGIITDVALYNGIDAYNIVHMQWNGSELIEVVPKSAIVPILEILKNKKLRGHNFSFDARFTHHYFGVDLWESIYEDSMLKAHTADENRFNYGLKELGADIFGRDVVAEKEALAASIEANGGSGKEFYKADSNIRAMYAMQDVQLTWRLCEHFEPLLAQDRLSEFFQAEVMELYRHVTIVMELRGVPVDVPLLQSAQVEITAELEALEHQIQAAIKPHLDSFNDWYIRTKFPFKMGGDFKQALAQYLEVARWPRTKTGTYSFSAADIARAVKKGLITTDTLLYKVAFEHEQVPEDIIRTVQLRLLADSGIKYPFNLLSKDHLKRLFYKKHGGPLDEKALSLTEKGAPQVNDDFLSAMAAKYPWAADLQIYNSLTKLKGTYIDRFLEAQENGIFYPSFFQHRTVSGRYSGDLQQLPRPLEAGDVRVIKFTNMVRRFFVALPGETFADFDYDSQEVKVFAHVSGDEGLKAIFAKGHDFYSTICIEAERLQGYSADKSASNYLGKVNKAARQRAKAYALGLAFGMTPYKLKFELSCTEAEAVAIYNGYMTAYPKLKEWMDNTKIMACGSGIIRTEAGRVRRAPELRRAYREHGEILFNGLELWKKFNGQPQTYEKMKELAGRCKNALNNSYNHQIQGLAASITNRAAIKTVKALKASGLEAYICNLTHDQITVRCKATDIETVAPLLTQAMETAYPISVPLTAPPSWGPNFAESKG